MHVIQPVILSGGSGTRLWPASRARYPKQLLPLFGEHTMLQQTARRLSARPGVSDETLVICNAAHRFLVVEQLRAIDVRARIVLEPEGRNTAPAAALAALLSLGRAPADAPPLLLIMPADHVIEPDAAFLETIAAGEGAAADGKLVMFGVVPSSAHTGYGYIEADARSQEVSPILSFVEKPDQKTAVHLLETNRYFWNSGLFLFRADAYLEELEKFEPAMVAACRDSIDNAVPEADFVRPDADAFHRCPSNSIDYAVMEKTGRGMMVPMRAGWSDVGSWSALHDVSARDEDGNSISGDVIVHNCKASYLSGRSRLIAAVGLDNLIVVEDRDSVLVVHRDQAQHVKSVVDRLVKRGRPETRQHRQITLSWGSVDTLDADDGFTVRRLIVNPGAARSSRGDDQAPRHWVIASGAARLTRGDEVFDLAAGESVRLPPGVVHRIENPGEAPLHVIEVLYGDTPGEVEDE